MKTPDPERAQFFVIWPRWCANITFMSSTAHDPCKTVLVVEDDPAARTTLVDILSDEGYRCVEAAEGREAIAQLSAVHEAPCVILLDLMMPVMNGWQFMEWLRQRPEYATVPVVVVSAVREVEAEARRLAAAAFVTKPIALEPLLQSVERYCGSRPNN